MADDVRELTPMERLRARGVTVNPAETARRYNLTRAGQYARRGLTCDVDQALARNAFNVYAARWEATRSIDKKYDGRQWLEEAHAAEVERDHCYCAAAWHLIAALLGWGLGPDACETEVE